MMVCAKYLDYQEDTWFQITNENCESTEQKEAEHQFLERGQLGILPEIVFNAFKFHVNKLNDLGR